MGNVFDAFGIRFVKLRCCLQLTEGGLLSEHKESAIRGGIGEMLLREHCLQKSRDCEVCSLEKECIVQRLMYSKLKLRPSFMTRGDSVGYVIECENYKRRFEIGEELDFILLLFGENIAYVTQYVRAIVELGRSGLGENAVLFRLKVVEDVSRGLSTSGDSVYVYDGNDVYTENLCVSTIREYVASRLEEIARMQMGNVIVFHTPLTQKYQKEFLQEFHMDAITRSIQRRLYVLNCFEGIDVEAFYQTRLEPPVMIEQVVWPRRITRYSNRQRTSMFFKGIEGEIYLNGLSGDLLSLYLAGELIHIGKNTSFGFGRYTIQ